MLLTSSRAVAPSIHPWKWLLSTHSISTSFIAPLLLYPFVYPIVHSHLFLSLGHELRPRLNQNAIHSLSCHFLFTRFALPPFLFTSTTLSSLNANLIFFPLFSFFHRYLTPLPRGIL